MALHDPEPEARWTRSCERIARDPRLTPNERRVLREITRRVASAQGEATLSDGLLGVLTGLPGKEVRGAIRGLVSKRYVSRRGGFCLQKGALGSYRLQLQPRGPEDVPAEPARGPGAQPATPPFRAARFRPQRA